MKEEDDGGERGGRGWRGRKRTEDVDIVEDGGGRGGGENGGGRGGKGGGGRARCRKRQMGRRERKALSMFFQAIR